MADPGHYAFRADWADLCAGVTVRDVYNLDVELRRGHVHPDGMLQTILTPWDAPNDPAAPVPAIGPYVVESADAKEVRYLANAKYFAASSSQPKELAEVYYNDPRKAVAALRSGEVALLDRVHPWDVESLRATTGLTVERYAVPTVHCLMLNFEKDFLAKRSFRRALVHGINRQEILNTQLLRGSSEELGKVVSGPFPRGTSLDDPTGYAYNEEIEPRPYDPRLAMILISLTRYEVKLANEKKEEAAAGGKPAPKAPAKTPEEEKKDLAANLPPVPALVLAHAPHEIARVACRSIQRQLKPLGLNITLKELPPESPCTPEGDWDLLYTELAMWEPVVDARQLLGPYGLAGRCSPHMDLALRRLDLADDWKRARDRLLEIHRLFHEDLPLVPLWQITDFFAYQQGLKNVGSRPAMLYQNIENWDAPAWFGTEAL
jgi:ABC-type transport system substrate-binding protein